MHLPKVQVCEQLLAFSELWDIEFFVSDKKVVYSSDAQEADLSIARIKKCVATIVFDVETNVGFLRPSVTIRGHILVKAHIHVSAKGGSSGLGQRGIFVTVPRRSSPEGSWDRTKNLHQTRKG